ncbi:hypothetical protein P8452_35263 [Trifolium repens]|nr:hypothetical protein P8452_35263 [Trifolium repens]
MVAHLWKINCKKENPGKEDSELFDFELVRVTEEDQEGSMENDNEISGKKFSNSENISLYDRVVKLKDTLAVEDCAVSRSHPASSPSSVSAEEIQYGHQLRMKPLLKITTLTTFFPFRTLNGSNCSKEDDYRKKGDFDFDSLSNRLTIASKVQECLLKELDKILIQ